MTMIDPIPHQTLASIREGIELLLAVNTVDLTECGQSGMMRLLREMAEAVEHLEETYPTKRGNSDESAN